MNIEAFITAGQAKTVSMDSAMLAAAGKRAQLAMQWGLAANYFDQTAEALPRDPHTDAETIQAQAHRRSAATCRALVGTAARNRLLRDCPEYGAIERAAVKEHPREWREWRNS
ncbi:hypothetical protein [Pantoea sp. 18069]|uniref:hypothetical protein n=1 Tax=Pantoea sp. 18069 TaxID=2681415 RepID=UPI00135BB796|nr:hypothetical protein [Pantoea sp. 18069]